MNNEQQIEISQNWFCYFDSFYTPMYKETLNMLRLPRFGSILDLSCNPGEFIEMAAREGIVVSGFDPEDFNGSELPFDDNSYDAITGFNLFQKPADFERLVQEAKRILKRNGRLAIGVWDRSGFKEFDRLTKAVDGPFPDLISSYSLSLAKKGRITAIFRKMGLHHIHGVRIRSLFSYRDMCEGIKNYLESSPAAMLMDIAEKEDLGTTLRNGFRQYHLIENTDFLRNSFLIVIAAKK